MQPGLRGRHTGLCLQRGHLRLGCTPLRLGAIERRLADVALGKQLLLAFVLLGCHVQAGLGCGHLCAAGRRALTGHARVDTRQLLPGFHGVTGLDRQGHDGARHLGREQRLAHRLDLGIHAAPAGAAGGLHRVIARCCSCFAGMHVRLSRQPNGQNGQHPRCKGHGKGLPVKIWTLIK